jgi:hypothetical protein
MINAFWKALTLKDSFEDTFFLVVDRFEVAVLLLLDLRGVALRVPPRVVFFGVVVFFCAIAQ